MIVVSDTSPLNYLVLIGRDAVLPALFGRVAAPPAVIAELRHPKTPHEVSAWAASPPAWLDVLTPKLTLPSTKLGPGETEAIALATELKADVLLIDDRDGVAAARQLNLFVTGTLGVLVMAADRGLLRLPDAITALCATTFRGPERLMEAVLARDAGRRPSPDTP